MGRQSKLKQARKEKRATMKEVPLKTLTQTYYVRRNDLGVKVGFGSVVATGIEFKPQDMETVDESYKDILLGIMSRSPTQEGRQSGFDVAEMRKSMKVIDKLEASNGDASVLLEDAEFELLKTRIDQTKWSTVTRTFLQFLEDILGAPVYEKPKEAVASTGAPVPAEAASHGMEATAP